MSTDALAIGDRVLVRDEDREGTVTGIFDSWAYPIRILFDCGFESSYDRGSVERATAPIGTAEESK